MAVRIYSTKSAGGGGGAGTTPPTAIWPETVSLAEALLVKRGLVFETLNIADFFAIKQAGLVETVTVDDGPIKLVTLKPTWPETLNLEDGPLKLVTLKPVWPETVSIADGAVGVAGKGLAEGVSVEDGPLKLVTLKPVWPETLNVRESRLLASFGDPLGGIPTEGVKGGTAFEDSWTDHANGGTNHGADTTLSVRFDTPVVNDGRRAYFKFNFKNAASSDPFFNLTNVAGQAQLIFSFVASHNTALISRQLSIYCATSVGEPFTEAGITWNNQPAPGTLVQNMDVQAGAAQRYNVDLALGGFGVAGVLGSWLQITILHETAASTTVFTIPSSENATSSDMPWLAFRMQRAV